MYYKIKILFSFFGFMYDYLRCFKQNVFNHASSVSSFLIDEYAAKTLCNQKNGDLLYFLSGEVIIVTKFHKIFFWSSI